MMLMISEIAILTHQLHRHSSHHCEDGFSCPYPEEPPPTFAKTRMSGFMPASSKC